MTFAELPYFLKDPSWYYYDEKEGKCKLTENAPEEAVKSYEETYKILDEET